jgi:hypothetical protein
MNVDARGSQAQTYRAFDLLVTCDQRRSVLGGACLRRGGGTQLNHSVAQGCRERA